MGFFSNLFGKQPDTIRNVSKVEPSPGFENLGFTLSDVLTKQYDRYRTPEFMNKMDELWGQSGITPFSGDTLAAHEGIRNLALDPSWYKPAQDRVSNQLSGNLSAGAMIPMQTAWEGGLNDLLQSGGDVSKMGAFGGMQNAIVDPMMSRLSKEILPQFDTQMAQSGGSNTLTDAYRQELLNNAGREMAGAVTERAALPMWQGWKDTATTYPNELLKMAWEQENKGFQNLDTLHGMRIGDIGLLGAVGSDVENKSQADFDAMREAETFGPWKAYYNNFIVPMMGSVYGTPAQMSNESQMYGPSLAELALGYGMGGMSMYGMGKDMGFWGS